MINRGKGGGRGGGGLLVPEAAAGLVTGAFHTGPEGECWLGNGSWLTSRPRILAKSASSEGR